jgi:hypothetical protein
MDIDDIIADPVVRRALSEAWRDSNPGPTGAREMGGFVLLDPDGTLSVAMWPPGDDRGVDALPHAGCAYKGRPIVATFHTHPNTGAQFNPEPTYADVTIVITDPDLRHPSYAGEIVISERFVYHIRPDGGYVEIGAREAPL